MEKYLVIGCAVAGIGALRYKSVSKKRQEEERDRVESERVQNVFKGHNKNRPRLNSGEILSMERNSVTVQVPATSANIGSGYDCLGMALDMWNELTVTRSDKFEMTAEGEGADDIPMDESNLVVVGLKAAFKAAGKRVPPLRYHMVQKIPHGRGLGSSSAAIVAGILAGLVLCGHKLDVHGKETMLQLATEIEGHPDNVAPAMYGGVQLGIYDSIQGRWASERINLPHGLVFVMFIPDFVGKTSDLRKVVPKQVPMTDAVFNMGRIAWLILALQNGKIDHIRAGLEDRLHQKQRGDKVYTHLFPLIDACYDAGAVGAYLSGAGPVVMAITAGGSGDFFTQSHTQRTDQFVADAMRETAQELGINGQVYITHPTNVGGVVVRADPPFSSSLVTYNGET
mmetsp:Transcript_17779/g.28778  ORF Transcript_17779/g.28778 Transcript_17779/m.28778 type:complete len:397 (-) Transcript_17779:792-1982(-)